MSQYRLSVVYTTVSTIEEAEKLAEKALMGKYAACLNIIPGAVSIYEWIGKLEKKQECLLIFKTSITKVAALKQWILENHPYSVPAILSSTVETSLDFYKYLNLKAS